MSDAPLEQKGRRGYTMHGDHARDRRLRARGLAAIDGRTAEGREALAWRDAVLKSKGGAVCPLAVKVEIKLACFDLFRLLHLQSYFVRDANERGTIVNRRRRELPRIHEQYAEIDHRFSRRVEALELSKTAPMDLATRLAQASQAREKDGSRSTDESQGR
jgi:hypothetical protein